VRPHHRIGNHRVFADVHRLQQHRIGNNGRLGHQRLAPFLQVLQVALVREHRGVLVAAVEPLGYAAGHEHHALVLHVLQGIGELVLALVLDVVVEQVLQLAAQVLAVLEIIDADDGQVRHKLLRLFHKVGDLAGGVQLHHPKGLWVGHLLHPNGAGHARIQGKVGLKQGIGKGHHQGASQRILGAQNGVGRAQRLVLVHNGALRPHRFGNGHEAFLHRIAKPPDDEGHLVHRFAAHLGNVFHEALHNGLARDRNQRLGNGEGVGAHALAHAGHRNDNLHVAGCWLLVKEHPGELIEAALSRVNARWAEAVELLRRAQHGVLRPGAYCFPVLPYPPAPRWVSLNASAGCQVMVSCLATISWAIRSPSFTTKGSLDKFTSSTFISPR